MFARTKLKILTYILYLEKKLLYIYYIIFYFIICDNFFFQIKISTSNVKNLLRIKYNWFQDWISPRQQQRASKQTVDDNGIYKIAPRLWLQCWFIAKQNLSTQQQQQHKSATFVLQEWRTGKEEGGTKSNQHDFPKINIILADSHSLRGRRGWWCRQSPPPPTQPTLYALGEICFSVA